MKFKQKNWMPGEFRWYSDVSFQKLNTSGSICFFCKNTEYRYFVFILDTSILSPDKICVHWTLCELLTLLSVTRIFCIQKIGKAFFNSVNLNENKIQVIRKFDKCPQHSSNTRILIHDVPYKCLPFPKP